MKNLILAQMVCAVSKDTDTAWAAGFFDGEGSTSCLKASRDKYRYIRMSISQKDRRCLDKFFSIVKVGKIYKHKVRDMHSWDLFTSTEVLILGEQLWPYLSDLKKEQFLKAIETVNLSSKNPLVFRKPEEYWRTIL